MIHVGGQPTSADYRKLYGTENTPLKAGNLLYTCTAKNIIVAMDAATGKPVWRVNPNVPDKWIPYTTACRGVAYYKVPGAAANSPCASRIIEGTLDSRLIEVDAPHGSRWRVDGHAVLCRFRGAGRTGGQGTRGRGERRRYDPDQCL